MEKLNEYLQNLLSTHSRELHLEPNKSPFLISNEGGSSNLSNAPLLGTQISMLVFPLIPAAVKSDLPNKAEIEFVLNHNLGSFNFHIKKSPAGFLVTICPLSGDAPQSDAPAYQPETAGNSVISKSNIAPAKSDFSNPVQSFDNAPTKKSAAMDFSEIKSDLPPVEIETVSISDPEFTTEFSDTSTYEPPVRPQEFAPTYAPAPTAPNVQTTPQVQPPTVAPNYQPIAAPNYQPQYQPSVEAAYAPATANPQAKAAMDKLFYRMAEIGASDLHLSVSVPPMIRQDGKMQTLGDNENALTADAMRELLTSIMPAKNQEEFSKRKDSDFAYEIAGLARFRANIFMDRKGMGAVFRIIPTKILTAEELGLSKAIMDLCNLSKGLVVVTGPTGSGKSTTLCAMVDSINRSREDHIITIEDPIEFTHENQKCLVNQREVHNHTDSFKDALRAALREDPDILLVGEMRDLETISIAIETAETGHLVFGTLHTTTAASTIDRIIDQFPADRQQQIRVMLSESLKGVIAQTLLPKKGGGRVAALEVLIVTPAISNLIREGKTFQIPSAMQTGKALGMVMLNDALMALVQKGLVEPRDAYIKAVEKIGLESLLTRAGFKI